MTSMFVMVIIMLFEGWGVKGTFLICEMYALVDKIKESRTGEYYSLQLKKFNCASLNIITCMRPLLMKNDL